MVERFLHLRYIEQHRAVISYSGFNKHDKFGFTSPTAGLQFKLAFIQISFSGFFVSHQFIRPHSVAVTHRITKDKQANNSYKKYYCSGGCVTFNVLRGVCIIKYYY